MSGRPAGTVTERLLARTDRTGDCWLWTGAPSGGYGAICISGRRWAAHRAMYIHFVDAIPDHHDISHTCGNRMCVRPDHLKAVPQGTGPQGRPVTDRARRAAARMALAAAAGDCRADHDPRADWRHRAACRTEDPELFHPVGTGPDAQAQTLLAKAVCRRCPVAQACGDLALTKGYSGIWGGLSDDDRQALRPDVRPREEQPCGTEAALKAHERAGEHCGTCRRAGSVRRAEQRVSA